MTALGAAAVLAITAVSVYMLWEKPPATAAEPEKLGGTLHTPDEQPSTPQQSPSPSGSGMERGTAFSTSRQDGVYTILLVGNDDGTGNTDTIMVAKLDTVRHTLNAVSIPRDTLINVDTPVRKINSVYWGARNNGNDGIEALRRHVRKLTGFDVDCYAVLDLTAFIEAVDAMGGIWYDVPERLYYDGGPVIDLDPGYQLLDGEQAMGLVRFRYGYMNGDLDRINVQHDFLKAAAEQFLSQGSIPNASKVISILAGSMDTNLSAANMAYFARQLMMCSSEDINFYTAPNTPMTVQNLSYTFLDLYDWLAMVNDCINPYSTPVTEGMLDLVYLYNGSVCCTGVLNGVGYFSMGGGKTTVGTIQAVGTEIQTRRAVRPAFERRSFRTGRMCFAFFVQRFLVVFVLSFEYVIATVFAFQRSVHKFHLFTRFQADLVKTFIFITQNPNLIAGKHMFNTFADHVVQS